jgi:hypothetical protein
MRAYVLMLAVALSFTACEGGSSSPVSPSPPTVSNWVVTQSFVSVSGPDNCWVRGQRATWTGAVFPELPMVVTREGTAITLVGEFFQVNYAGTASGRNFTANGGPLEGSVRSCDGATFEQKPGVSRLTGSFSADDTLLRATETNSYTSGSGESVTYVWDWQATRRN